MRNDFMLFSGTSNKPLAQKVSDILHVSLGNAEITRFIDNECRVYVKDSVTGKHVFVLQSLSAVADQNLVELCLLGSALHDMRVASITAVIPWMGYSKQDKAFRKGEAISAQLVARFIEAAGFTGVITCELHSENVMPYFSVPIVALSTHKLLVHTLRKISRLSLEKTVVVSPDKGGVSRSESFAQEAGFPMVRLSKTRDLTTGDVSVTGISGEVRGKDCIIFDDIINTGATAIKTASFLKQHGAKKIYFLATHGVLAGDASRKLKDSSIDSVILTDTIDVPKEKRFSKMRIISAATLISDAIITQ